MKRSKFNILITLAMLALGLSSLLLFTSQVTAQRESRRDVTLRPGLVFHPTLNVGYVMTPTGIAAVDLTTGEKQWTSNAAAKPLTLVGNLLVSQVEPTGARNVLELAVLNIQQRGQPTVRGEIELPSNVRVAVGETPEGDQFEVHALPSLDNAIVSWSFKPAPRRVLDEQSERDERKASPRVAESIDVRGALQMNLTSGKVTRLDAVSGQMPPPPRWTLVASQKLSDAAPSQYESADGKNVAATELIADDRVWEKYKWTVYERASGQRIGEFRTHLSFTPFVVRDRSLIYETTPYILGRRSEPAKLRGVSLATGQETWGVEVRENVYRGPLPP